IYTLSLHDALPILPDPMRIARSSDELSACAPSSLSRSRGRSVRGSSRRRSAVEEGMRRVYLRCMPSSPSKRRDLVRDYAFAPWHFLNFFPLPHGHGSLRPTLDQSAVAAPPPAASVRTPLPAPTIVGSRRTAVPPFGDSSGPTSSTSSVPVASSPSDSRTPSAL